MITIGMTGLESGHNQQRRKYQSMTRFKNDDNRIVVLNQNTTNGENPNLYWQSKSIDGGNRKHKQRTVAERDYEQLHKCSMGNNETPGHVSGAQTESLFIIFKYIISDNFTKVLRLDSLRIV